MVARGALIYAAVCVFLWFIPVLDRLHVESSAAIATVSFFVAGGAALRGNRFHFGTLGPQLMLLLLPLGMLLVAAFWAPNCDWKRGLLFFAVFPPVTVVFSTALARFLGTHTGRPRTWHATIGIAILLIGPLYDFGLHPQFYSYNHIFGGALGPIYDEELVVRPGLFVFRGLTLLWAGFLTCAAAGRSRKGILFAMAIGGVYLFSGRLGINTTYYELSRALDGHTQTAHFDLYYDSGITDAFDVLRLKDEHEYRYHQLTEKSGFDVPNRIQSYIYPDAETRARLTGARFTSVSPVWLSVPQIHILSDQYGEVLTHELAHVFSREFGIPLIHASPYIGLVEGFAVAMEPPDGGPRPIEEVAASRRALQDDVPLDIRLAASLSPTGFWGGRGAVGYTTNGAFVGYLIETYGINAFTSAYAWGNFSEAYGRDVDDLASEWAGVVDTLTVLHPDAPARAIRRFAVPSLFETSCPHWTSPPLKEVRRAVQLPDTLSRVALDRVFRKYKYLPALILESAAAVRTGQEGQIPDAFFTRADSIRTITEWSILGDAFGLKGQSVEARAAYKSALSGMAAGAGYARLNIVLKERLLIDSKRFRQFVTGDSTLWNDTDFSPDPEGPGVGDLDQRALFRLAGAVLAVSRKDLSRAGDLFRHLEVSRLRLPVSPARLDGVVLMTAARVAYDLGRLEWARMNVEQARQIFEAADSPWMSAVAKDWSDRITWRSTKQHSDLVP